MSIFIIALFTRCMGVFTFLSLYIVYICILCTGQVGVPVEDIRTATQGARGAAGQVAPPGEWSGRQHAVSAGSKTSADWNTPRPVRGPTETQSAVQGEW